MKAVILAGGFGTRLRPLTVNIPKPMVPVMNVPMLEHIINLLKKNGFTDIIINLFYQPEIIINYFKEGSSFGVRITYIRADRDLGTAGCITRAKDIIKEDSFLVISGDVLTNFDLKQVVEFHNIKKAITTIVLTKSTEPLRYGIVITEQDGRVKKLLEKPSWGEVFSDTINTGIYVFNPEIFKYIPEETNYDFAKNLFPDLLNKKENLYGCTTGGYWKDIGILAEYRQVHEDILNGEIDCEIKGERKGTIGRDVWVGKNVKIHPDAKLKDSVVIGNNVTIEADVEISNSVIGNDCYIDSGAKIVRSILWDKNVIEKEVDIKECVLGAGNKIRWKSYIGVGAVISDNCFIGKESIIKPEVKLWPDKKVDDFSIVSSSLVWGERWSNRLFDIYGITAVANLELTPEIGAKIGSAYASTLPKDSYILISRDYHRSSFVVERAIMSGILSTGVNIYDFRIMPLPVTKYVAKSLQVAGGLHIRKSPYDERMIDIKFFDKDGMDISLSQEKTIESSFFREEFRRVENDKVGIISYPPRALEYYIEGLKKNIDFDIIKQKKFKIVIDYSYGITSNIFPSIPGELNCEVIALNAYFDEKRLTRDQYKFEADLEKLATAVKTLKADAGIMIDAGSQKIFIVDNKGRILKNDDGILIMIKLFLNKNKGKTVAVPVNITSKAEEVAKEAGGNLIRCGTTYRAMMSIANEKKADFVAEEKGGYIFSDFNPTFDAMISTVKFLEFMACYNSSLSSLVDTLPSYNLIIDEEAIPWEKRGYVMTELLSLSDNENNIEGIEFKDGGSRILIIPDNDRPYFHIYVEGKTKQAAKSHIEKYKKMLKRIIGKI